MNIYIYSYTAWMVSEGKSEFPLNKPAFFVCTCMFY